ncbi:MAG: sodium:solute symporter [Nitriliruptoraceae bacterium]|nr:sodium:solute symporter [Nitriliruptoraceae bacterium]
MTGEFEVATIDLVILGAYVVGILALGFYVGKGKKDSESYFLAGRGSVWWLVGFSLFGANMSGSSFVGIAGGAYAEGVAIYNYEWMATVILVIFALFILPFYLRSGASTMPEFLEARYDTRSRSTFSVFTIITTSFVDAAGAMFAGGLALQVLFPEIPLWQTIAFIALLGGLYTLLGGLQAVMITDTVQAVLLIAGGLAAFLIGWNQIGSLAQVFATAESEIGPDAMSIIRPADDEFLPWPGIFLGVFIVGFYFWVTNQVIVQKVLSAKDLDAGRNGSLFAGLLKLFIIFVMVFPGLMALELYPDLDDPDLAFPTIAFDLLPIGIRGLVLAALIAAIMSSLDSTLNAASTLVTYDFIKRRNPEFDEGKLLVIGRVVVGIFMVLTAAWAPQIANFDTLWEYLQSFLSWVVPPIVTVFVAGLVWRRATATASFVTLIVGVPIGLVGFFGLELAADLLFDGPPIQFLYAAGLMLAFSIVLMVVVSLRTDPPDDDTVERFTWTPAVWHAETEDLQGTPWYANYRYLSVGLLALTTAFLVPFL